MKLSIVVLTHNRMAALRECLIRIEANTIEADAEVLVVNNGSTDRTREWVDIAAANKNPIPITVIHRETNEGVCARNYALEVAAGEFVAQVDDDVLVQAGWDQALIKPMLADETIGATGFDAHYQEQSWSKQPWSAGLIDDRRKPQPGQFVDFLTGWCKMWRALDPPILYDWDFSPHWTEESDWDCQMRVRGYRLMMVKDFAIHRSLKDWKAVMANEGPTAAKYADEHFALLKQKWQGDSRLRFEGALVGLR